MLWVFIALAIVVAVVLAGRAHSRYLDRQDQLHAQGHLNNLLADIIASEQRSGSHAHRALEDEPTLAPPEVLEPIR